MKTMRAKALASLLAGFVTLAGVSGCHASSAAMFSESATISASSAPQDSASSTTQISQTSEAGTYVQDDMTELMPQTYAYFTDLRLSADGAVEVVGLSQSGGIQLLRWTDDVWETAVESSQPAVANGALTVAADGTLWTVCRDDSGAYTLQSGTDPAAMQTIPVEALSQEEALPISLRLAADGKIFLTAQVGETTVFVLVDPATRQATTVTPGFYGSPAFYAEGSIYTFAAGSTSLSVLDATNGSVLQQYSLPLAEPLARASAAAIQQNCLIWADSNGIHQIALGGTLQQNLADNRSFALASSSFIVQQIVLDGQGNYWVSGVNAGGQAQIYRYRYDTQAAVASGGELVVWAMEDSLLLRETVNTYASEHPEQTVTVEYGQDSLDNGMTVDDVIRTLNVEIFAGEGPDVLVLDGLPVESYIRQGILADLSNIDTSNCYENIVHCYADESGCWALPLLSLYGRADVPGRIAFDNWPGPRAGHRIYRLAPVARLADARTVADPAVGYAAVFCHVLEQHRPVCSPGGREPAGGRACRLGNQPASLSRAQYGSGALHRSDAIALPGNHGAQLSGIAPIWPAGHAVGHHFTGHLFYISGIYHGARL